MSEKRGVSLFTVIVGHPVSGLQQRRMRPSRWEDISVSSNLAPFSGGELYSGTVADFSGSDALIIRDSVRTEQYDLKHLNGEWKKQS